MSNMYKPIPKHQESDAPPHEAVWETSKMHSVCKQETQGVTYALKMLLPKRGRKVPIPTARRPMLPSSTQTWSHTYQALGPARSTPWQGCFSLLLADFVRFATLLAIPALISLKRFAPASSMSCSTSPSNSSKENRTL